MRFVPDREVSLFNGLALIGIVLVRISDGERDEWIDETVATLGAGEQGDLVREYIRLFHEAETQRLLKHIQMTIDEDGEARAVSRYSNSSNPPRMRLSNGTKCPSSVFTPKIKPSPSSMAMRGSNILQFGLAGLVLRSRVAKARF